MKTTIMVLISIFMTLPGIKKTATQTSAREKGSSFFSVQNPDTFIQSPDYSQFLYFTGLFEYLDNPVNYGLMPELDMNSIEKEMEANPSIENWMTNPESWNQKSMAELNDSSMAFFPFIDDIYKESDPLIENWMTEPQKWSEKNKH